MPRPKGSKNLPKKSVVEPIPEGFVEVTGKCKTCQNLFVTMSPMGGDIPQYCHFCSGKENDDKKIKGKRTK